MRSLLLVPGDDCHALEGALCAGADALILDLANSGAPNSTVGAPDAARTFLETCRGKKTTIRFARVNPLASGRTDDDLATIMPAEPDGIVLGKVEGGQDIQELASRLAVYEARLGLRDGQTRILAIAAETASSVFAMGSFRDCSRRLVGIAWDAEALRADLAAEAAADGGFAGPCALARSLTLLAARSAGVPAFDTVEPEAADEDRFARACVTAQRDGFSGKLVIRPEQVSTVNRTFKQKTPASARRRAP